MLLLCWCWRWCWCWCPPLIMICSSCGLLAIVLVVTTVALGVQGGLEPKGYDEITCGSTVKLKHTASKFLLHSQDVAYGSGSGQQSVTTKKDEQDSFDFWQIKGTEEKECPRAEKIRCGSTIRLFHVRTQRWLHSHNFKSPLSQNQEVSAYGDSNQSDSGDNWKLECSGTYWKKGSDVMFKHVDTGFYLHSTGKHQYNRPIEGQREACAIKKSSSLNKWQTADGYFVKPL
eukprot:m.26617 g.26617  ORF g.26617 m.26617 type:complete len:230 (+) comp5870_c1_seq1:749-1438(+)